MADDFTTSLTLRGLAWDAAQVRLKERWSAKVHVQCERVSALQAFLAVLYESQADITVYPTCKGSRRDWTTCTLSRWLFKQLVFV